MKTKKLWVVAALVLFSVGCKSKPKDENEIRIGEFGSMTGTEATFGISTHHGIELVIDEVNAKGGVNGKKLKLISLDDQGKSEEAQLAVQRMITQDKVHVILGEVASSRSLAAAPVAQRYKIPMISPSSTNPKVTEVGDYIFRVCFTDPFQGKIIAKFSAEDLKAKTAALLIDTKSDYSVGLAEFFKKTFGELGGKVIIEQNYVGGDIDFKGQLTAIKSKKPDIIVVPGYYTEAGLILKQARELGLNMPVLGGDGWDSPKLFEIAGKSANGSYISNHYSSEDKDPRVQAFVSSFKARFKEIPDGLAVMGYDAALVLVDALKRAKSLSGPDLKDAIAQTKNFPAVTGLITIDKDRNAAKPAVMLKIEDNNWKFATRVNP
ncbi:MAG: branched-chain amino acid transporter, amino acid-binding protein [Bacteriovoracaceae bacterium]|nr:branched-chain amino acid transporter, amino acid-binding protein [Bacteriovoracaceae bacterium]